jgi:hypothetical protein
VYVSMYLLIVKVPGYLYQVFDQSTQCRLKFVVQDVLSPKKLGEGVWRILKLGYYMNKRKKYGFFNDVNMCRRRWQTSMRVVRLDVV